MANYTVEQACKMIDDCFTPEYLMMEKAIERQYYIDIFTEMHNYISENIIELPFDAEVFTEEDQKDNVETKNVWDKNDKGWSGFWHNVWRVIKNIWRQFWAFIRSIVGQKDYIKPEEGQKIADKAEAVAKDLEQKSDQEVQKAVEEKPEEVKAAMSDIKDISTILQDALSKLIKLQSDSANLRNKINASKTAKNSADAIKKIDERELTQQQEILNKNISIFEKIIADPSSFKDQKNAILGFLNTIKGTLSSQTVNDDNKLCNLIKSQGIVNIVAGKSMIDLINVYSKQNSAAQTAIINGLNTNMANQLSHISNAATHILAYSSGAVDKYMTLASAPAKAGGGTVTGNKKVVNSAWLTAFENNVKAQISYINNFIIKIITDHNISILNKDDYSIDFDATTGIIKNIDTISEIKDIDISNSNIDQSVNGIRDNITTIVQSSAMISKSLFLLKSIPDRKIASLINDAINKLQSLT